MDREWTGKIGGDLWNVIAPTLPEGTEAQRRQLLYKLAETDFFRECEPPEEKHRRIDQDLTTVDRYYVIKNSELALLSESSNIVSNALGATAVFSHGVTAIAFLVYCFYQYRRNRVEIAAWQARPLLALAKMKPEGLTIEQLAEEAGMSIKVVEEALNSLRDAVAANGRSIELVAERDGTWRAVDV